MSLRNASGHTFPKTTRTYVYREYEEELESSKEYLKELVLHRTSPFALADLTPGRDWRGIPDLQLIHDVVAARYPQLQEASIQKRAGCLGGRLLKNVLIESEREFVQQPEKRPGTGANIYRMVD